jgi:hypothetical protein
VSVLAHVMEDAGLATIVLASMRPVVEKMRPPRALYCEFPLGRPLGIPNDPAFQHRVLTAAFELLCAPEGPVIVDFPEVIESDEQPVACAIPPRFDPNLPACVDEARGLRAAYERSLARRGRTDMGRVLSADQVPEALDALHRIASGEEWKSVGIPGGNTIAVMHDIRSYYDEACLELTDGPAPGGRAVEAWFFESTQAGRTTLAARQALKDAGAPFPMWFYMAPGHR